MSNHNQKLKFSLEVFNVLRDFSQGLYANRIPLNHPTALKIFGLLNELIKYNNGTTKLGNGEIGGADPQVSAVFRNADYMETYRQIRQVAQQITLRALWRGINGFLLEPSNEQDLRHLLTHLAQDVADSELTGAQKKELLRIKIFDSQGNMDEVQSTINILRDLYNEGYPLCAEVAIPYSSGEIYTDELYVNKALDAARRLQAAGLPLNDCRISLKDMVGELDGETASRLLDKIIDALQANNLNIPIGLHLHDTGLAKLAYASAIETCLAKDYPITIDTVECDTLDLQYTNNNEWKNTGFADFLAVNETLKERGINLDIPKEQLAIMKEIGHLTKDLAKEFDLVRVDSTLSGEELRKFHIPGGGFASFSKAVKSLELAKKFPLITEAQTLQIAGYALIAVAKLMGEPFAVTPGFQNKQIAALNFLQNLMRENKLSADMSFEKIIEVIGIPLENDQVETLFLNRLSPVVKEFLRGEMPGPVHPVIREKLGKRNKALDQVIPPKVHDAENIAIDLLKKGKIKPTHTQARAVLRKVKLDVNLHEELLALLSKNNTIYDAPNGSVNPWQAIAYEVIFQFLVQKNYDTIDAAHLTTDILAQLEFKTIQTHTTWALELGDPKKLIDAIDKHWLREPDPSKKEGYHEALKRFQEGKNPNHDEFKLLFEEIRQGHIPLATVNEYVQLILQKEHRDIKNSVLEFLNQRNDSIEKIVSDLYAHQKNIIIEKERTGTYFLLPESARLDFARHFLKETFMMNVDGLSEQMSVDSLCEQIDIAWKEIENIEIRSFMGGKVLFVTDKNDIKQGDSIAVIEAAKMETTMRAPSDGMIDIAIKAGDMVARGQILARYHKKQTAENTSSTKVTLGNTKEFFNQTEEITDTLSEEIKNKQQEIKTKLLMEDLHRSGYYGQPLSIKPNSITGQKDEIHVIDNRAGCATKLYADLKQAGYKVRILCAPGDETTAVIANAKKGEVIPIKHYNDQEAVLKALENIATHNETKGKKIFLHPGWGFLSENDEFVAKLEAMPAAYNINFVGPASEPMRRVGGKKTLRDLVKEVAPEFNPKYFGLNDYPELMDQFIAIKNMGGNVVIKAVAGGGGRGIKFFKINDKLTDQQNYHDYVNLLQENRAFSRKYFGNDDMIIEQCITGNTRHLEVQFATTKKGGFVLGLRDCTAQNNHQKIIETNVIEGDYPPGVINKVLLASKNLAKKLSEIGYEGVGTLEMLVQPDGNVTFLEVNTRVQVEHMVTEDDISVKTGKNISIPLINLLCKVYPNELPEEILKRIFGLTDNDLLTIKLPGIDRITHFRLNSREVDFTSGKSIASYFHDWMSNITHTFKDMFYTFKARIIRGGLGQGSFDPQIGAVCGREANSLHAANAMRELVETSRACHRNDGKLSIDFVLEFYKLMYDDKGRFNSKINTKTVDAFLKAIEEGKIVLALDHDNPSMSPKLKIGAMQKGFDDFLALTPVSEDRKLMIAKM